MEMFIYLPNGNHLGWVGSASSRADARAFFIANGTAIDKQMGGSPTAGKLMVVSCHTMET